MATVFRTGHEINERVCDALAKGFAGDEIATTYGILRGSGEWAQRERAANGCLLWDKGYFKPGHYDGYYRASWMGTQAPFYPYAIDDTRWRALGMSLEPWQERVGGHILICPPTEPAARFHGIPDSDMAWAERVKQEIAGYTDARVIIRCKGAPNMPLEKDLDGCAAVVTFNSSVGWRALRQGIPVVSDIEHSTIGSYLRTTVADLGKPMRECDRYPLFSFMANRQFTLAEISNGLARRYLL